MAFWMRWTWLNSNEREAAPAQIAVQWGLWWSGLRAAATGPRTENRLTWRGLHQ